jgi:hypothetical protein
VLPVDVRPRRLAHRPLRRLARGQELERRSKSRHLVLANRDLERDVVRQFGEPPDVADDERRAERERSNCTPRRLAHRRGAQQHAGIARRHQRPEPFLVDVVDPLDPVAEESVDAESGSGGSDEQERRVRVTHAHELECLDQLREALARVQVAEAPEDRPAVHARRLNGWRAPGGMWDPPEHAVVAGFPGAGLDVGGVDDETGGEVEHLAGEREVFRPRLPERRHAPVEETMGEQSSRQPRVTFDGREVGAPILPPDRQAGDEVV